MHLNQRKFFLLYYDLKFRFLANNTRKEQLIRYLTDVSYY